MSHPAAATTTPQDHELPVGSTSMRVEALYARHDLDDSEILQMLFRSECFAEDLVEAYATTH